MSRKHKLAALSAALLAGLALSACTSNGPSGTGGSSGGGGITGGSSGGPPNDGTGPTNITSGGTPVSGHFVCTQSAQAYDSSAGKVTTAVGSNGLVGGPLTALLQTLGGSDATTLLNSVINPNNVIDGNLDTYATTTLTLGLLGGLLDSVDLSVLLPTGTTVPAGQFAVYAISFPNGTVDLSLINKVAVTTYLDNVAQESNSLTQSDLSLLGAIGGSTVPPIFVGIEATKPYDRATLSLTPGVLSADVGNAMYTYEFCPGGTLVIRYCTSTVDLPPTVTSRSRRPTWATPGQTR